MAGGTRGDLGGVGDDQDLGALPQLLQALAHGIGNRAADAAVDLVEDQGAAAGGTRGDDLERQHEAREFAARGDAVERAGRAAGVGRDLEEHPLGALAAAVLRVEKLQRRLETRLVHAQGGEFAGHGLVEPGRGLAPGGRKPVAGGIEGGAGHIGLPRQAHQRTLAVLQGGQFAGQALAHLRQLRDRGVVAPGGAAQGKETFLGGFQATGIGIEIAPDAGDALLGLVDLEQGAVERGQGLLERAAGNLAHTRQFGRGMAQAPLRAVVFLQRFPGGGKGGGNLLGIAQARAQRGQFLLLAGHRLERIEFLDLAAQQALAFGQAIGIGLHGGQPVARLGPGGMGLGDGGTQRAMAAVAVEDGAVGLGPQQVALVVLAVDLDQGGTELGKQGDADGVVVDEGTAAPVGTDLAAHDDLPAAGDAGRFQQGDRLVIGRDLEDGRDRGAFGAGPHEA